MNTSPNTSKFARALQQLLDQTKVFDRSQWAAVLNVPEHEIAGWVDDRSYPAPETLRRIIRTMDERRKASRGSYGDELRKDIFEDFAMLSKQPLRDVAPHIAEDAEVKDAFSGGRVPPTLEHYITLPVRRAFLELLGTMDPMLQEEVLFGASALARAVRDGADLALAALREAGRKGR